MVQRRICQGLEQTFWAAAGNSRRQTRLGALLMMEGWGGLNKTLLKSHARSEFDWIIFDYLWFIIYNINIVDIYVNTNTSTSTTQQAAQVIHWSRYKSLPFQVL